MKKLGLFVYLFCFIFIHAEDDISGLVLSGSEYINDKDGKPDTVKSDFQFIVNTTSNFLFIKNVGNIYDGKIPFKNLKIKSLLDDPKTSQSMRKSGYTQSRLFTLSCPFEKEEGVFPSFISWSYNSLSKMVEVKVMVREGSANKIFTLLVEKSRYLNWDKGIIFEKKFAIDKYLLEIEGDEKKNESTEGFIILSDTAVTVESKQIKESFPYEMIFLGKEGLVGYMARSFIIGFPNPYSLKDKYFQVMLDRNRETGDWERIIMFREKK